MTTTQPGTVVPLPDSMRDAMRKQANKGLMVHWINQHVIHRGNNDVRRSIVFYDADGIFEEAVPAEYEQTVLEAEFLQRLFNLGNIRYWSKGIV